MNAGQTAVFASFARSLDAETSESKYALTSAVCFWSRKTTYELENVHHLHKSPADGVFTSKVSQFDNRRLDDDQHTACSCPGSLGQNRPERQDCAGGSRHRRCR